MLRRITSTSALPLTLAVQGVGLTVVAFFLSSNPSRDPSFGNGSGDSPALKRSNLAEFQIPRDLAREQLPVPKFPRFDDPPERNPQPAPKPDPLSPKAPIAEGPKLAALRV
ncbi:MAG: hypothetical protein ACRD21_15785, partial [Vicinamibacteria bacterium]